MHVILTYDVQAHRTTLFKQISQKYLSRVQNSVFEGELTKSQLMGLLEKIKSEIEVNAEVVRVLVIADSQIFKVHTIGTPKVDEDNFL